MTGVLMARKGLAKPVGSMTQYDKMRVGRGENKKYLHYGEIVPLASLNDIVFGAWMFIRLMPMSQLLMQKFCKRKISIL